MREENYYCDRCKIKMVFIEACIEYWQTGKYSEKLDLCKKCFKDIFNENNLKIKERKNVKIIQEK